MTRESKLALMIAVTLILLVGVLLSDHLSGATEAQFEDAPVARKAATPVAVLPGTETRAADPIASLPAGQEPARLAADDPFGEPVVDPFSFEPVVIAQGPDRGGIIESALTGVDSAIQRVRASDPPVLAGFFEPVTDESVTLPPRDPRGDTPVKPVGEPQLPQITLVNPGWSTAEPVAVASWKTHTVAAGDNLYRLAARYLGDGDRWPELQAMNSDLLKGSETVQVGMVLKVGRGEARMAKPAAKPVAKPAPAASGVHREYVVLKGDMLSAISQKLLGTVRRMDEIVKLNGLKDPDDIRVGQTLKIPAR